MNVLQIHFIFFKTLDVSEKIQDNENSNPLDQCFSTSVLRHKSGFI